MSSSKSNLPRYRFHQLTSARCGVSEANAIGQLYSVFYPNSGFPQPSLTDIRLTCKRNYVIVAREHREKEEPIVGVLVLAVSHLFGGPIGKIEHPMLLQGFETLSVPLFAEAIKYLRRHGVDMAEVIHRVRGVAWPHRLALQGHGFAQIGTHVHQVKLV